jgi:hypothetical protein
MAATVPEGTVGGAPLVRGALLMQGAR